MSDEYAAYTGWGFSAQEQIDGFRREVRELRDENAKLRELCEYLWEFAKTCGADHPFLRELGVDDG